MKSFLYLTFFISFCAFSQEISKENAVNQIYLPKAHENTVTNLMKYKGAHLAKSVEEYKFTAGKWLLIKTDTAFSQINYNNYYLTFKRSYFKEPLVRYILFDGYNDKDNYYFYASYYGDIHIYGGFKTVVLFDNIDSEGNPTNKYIFNF